MKRFHSQATQSLSARPFRRRRLRLRHVVLPLLAAGLMAGLLSLSGGNTPETAAAPDAALAHGITAAAMAPHAANMRDELKTAFDAAPASAAVHLPVRRKKIEQIQDSISGILSAGGEYLAARGKTLAVGRGDTLMELLVRNHVPRGDAHEAIQALAKVYDPRGLRPRHEITVFFHEDPAVADPQFSGLTIRQDAVNSVRVSRDGDGSYTAGREERPVRAEIRAFRGVIDSSLYVSAAAQGVPDSVILDLIRMYSWGVDFQREIQNGDGFEVMYEEFVTDDGEVVPGKGDVVYASLTLSGQEMPLYRFADSSGDTDYFDGAGQSVKKPLMKTPIDGARISSGFGMRRHPVLGYSKMHKGMDFAAPRGTPVYAAGDGTVERMGPFSSYGNYIRIRHRAGLQTAYAHLKGFKAGLKSGSRVKQGQVIGYVGTTGRSTGPHLHYEVLMGGKQANPAKLKLSGGKTLADKDLKKFKAQVATLDRQFRDATRSMAVASR